MQVLVMVYIMDDFNIIILGVTGLYLLVGSLVINVYDLLSSLLFKVIPFFLGFLCLLSTSKLIGWL